MQDKRLATEGLFSYQGVCVDRRPDRDERG